jgi:hypothetical protein
MMQRRMVFCEIIDEVVGTFAPVDVELLLGYSVLEPVKMHIHRFRATLFYVLVGNTGGAVVVDL